MVPTNIAHNCTKFAIIKNLLFSSAKIFENNIIATVLGITQKEAICIGIIDSVNFVKKFSIKYGEKKNTDNEIKTEPKIRQALYIAEPAITSKVLVIKSAISIAT